MAVSASKQYFRKSKTRLSIATEECERKGEEEEEDDGEDDDDERA
jgi:hypothetical protein